jgi:hypothetical protein
METEKDIENIKKQAIFDSMSEKRRKQVLKRGYDKWNPFLAPKDPIDIRKDKTQRTSQMLVREFLQNCPHEDYSNSYGRGVLDMCIGIINDDERYKAMFEFSCWYKELLEKEAVDIKD